MEKVRATQVSGDNTLVIDMTEDMYTYVSLNGKSLPETNVSDADWDIIEAGDWTTTKTELL